MNREHESLVDDALFNRLRPAADSCLVHNVAGVRLLNQGPEALPAIEEALKRVATSPSYDDFDGLKYVLGSYAVISSRVGFAGYGAFMASLPPALQLEGLYSLHAFFRKMPDGFNSGLPPGTAVLDYLSTTAKGADARLQRESMILLDYFEARR